MDWYYADENGNRVGPLSDEIFRGSVEDGTITDATLVWHEGLAAWEPYASVVNPAVASGSYADHDSIPQTTHTVDSSGIVYGGFWIRFAAKVIDGVILFTVQSMLQITIALLFEAAFYSPSNEVASIIIGLLYFSTSILVPIIYGTWFIGRYGATPGKMAVGVKVVRSDGTSLTYGRAFVRHISTYLSGLILMIGYIMAAFDAEKRALHDHICDTRVVVSRR